MFHRLVVMQRRADLSPAGFRRHWLKIHAPLMAQLPGVRYVQNHVVETAHPVSHLRGKVEVDGFAQISFASEEAMREAGKHQASVAAGSDLPNFVGALTRLVCDVHAMVPAPAPGTAVKQMSLLYAKPRVEEHAAMLTASPGVLGYTQNIVTAKLPILDSRLADAGVEAALVLEMWYASPEAMKRAEFLSAVTSYLVEEIQIAG